MFSCLCGWYSNCSSPYILQKKNVAIPLRLVSEVDARKKKLMGLHDSIAELKASYDANKSLKLLDSIIVYFHDCNVYMISHVCLICFRPEQIKTLQDNFRKVEEE